MDNLQFNPDAFNVKPNAKHAKASARIEELAQPIQRGGPIITIIHVLCSEKISS